MKLYLDSADLDEVKEIKELGILDGVTTNPSLIKKAIESRRIQGDFDKYIKQLLKVADESPVSLEVIGDNYESMISEAKILYKKFNRVRKNVVIKIPISSCMSKECVNTTDSLKVIKELSEDNIPVNCTLIFTPEQALMAAKAGAKYVSPFVGRIDDYIRTQNKVKFDKKDYYPIDGMQKKGLIIDDNGIVSGIDLVSKIVQIFKKYDIETEVLAASIRSVRQFRDSALVGSDIATVPYQVIRNSLDHPKTMEGMINFTNDVPSEYKKFFEK